MYSTIENIINRNKDKSSKSLSKEIKNHIDFIIKDISEQCEYTSTQYLSNQLLKKIK